MNEEANDLPPSEESLAETMPDPVAPPKPVKAEDPALRGLGIAGVAIVTVGGLLFPLSVATRATAGATQSAKIKWEQRQVEVQKAQRAQQAAHDDQAAKPEEGPRDRDGK